MSHRSNVFQAPTHHVFLNFKGGGGGDNGLFSKYSYSVCIANTNVAAPSQKHHQFGNSMDVFANTPKGEVYFRCTHKWFN